MIFFYLYSQGLYCPKNYNPADFFIQKLAIVPTKKQECIERVNAICNKFVSSPFYYALESDLKAIEFGRNKIKIVDHENKDRLVLVIFNFLYKIQILIDIRQDLFDKLNIFYGEQCSIQNETKSVHTLEALILWLVFLKLFTKI